MATVTFKNVSKTYKDGTRAVIDMDLEISDGEFMVLVGPSGCGKTTALRMVAGLEAITGGELLIGGRTVNDLSPKERDIAMVFQNYSLYPHMSVYENIAFPLRAQRLPKREIKDRVERTAKLLGLEEHLKRRPRHLSGGQRQRVAMGRALVRQPQVFLMDEPLSNLDAKLRVEMRGEITKLQHDLGVTTIYVTHDQVEAMTMGDRIAVMRTGVLQQVGEPQTLYDRPANLFVAGFIGSPPMNMFVARIDVRDGRPLLALEGQELPLPDGFLSDHPDLAARLGKEVVVGIRPENLQDARQAPPQHPRLKAPVTAVQTLGAERHVHVQLPARRPVTEDVLDVIRDVDPGEAADYADHADQTSVRAISCFDADSDVAVGDVCLLAFTPRKLRFFDLESGVALA